MKFINKHFWFITIILACIVALWSSRYASATLTRDNQGPGFIVYSGSVVAADATGNSDSFPVERFVTGAFQAVWAASNDGNTAVFELQSSIDETNWVTVSGSSTATSGTSGSVIYNLATLPGAKLRLAVTNAGTSGSTLTPYFIGKGNE